MTMSTTFETESHLKPLRELFHDAWEQARAQSLPDGRSGSTRRRIAMQCCPIGALRDALLRLLAENHEKPASDMAPQIRCMIADRDFAGDGGNEAMDPHHDFLIHRYTESIVQALEQVRLRAHEQGLWSSEPVTPQMFG